MQNTIAGKRIQQAPRRRLDRESYGYLARFGHHTGRWDIVHDVADFMDRDRNQLSLDLPRSREEIRPEIPLPRAPMHSQPRRYWFRDRGGKRA